MVGILTHDLSGNEINFFLVEDINSKYPKLVIQNQMNMRNCIADYMIPVIENTISLINNDEKDNFIEALQLNETILNIINN